MTVPAFARLIVEGDALKLHLYGEPGTDRLLQDALDQGTHPTLVAGLRAAIEAFHRIVPPSQFDLVRASMREETRTVQAALDQDGLSTHHAQVQETLDRSQPLGAERCDQCGGQEIAHQHRALGHAFQKER